MRWRDSGMVDWSLTWHDGWQSSLSSFHFNTSLPPTHHDVSPSSSSLPEARSFSSLPPFFQYLLHLQISLLIKKQGLTDSGQHLVGKRCEHGANHFILNCSVCGEVSRRWSCCTAACMGVYVYHKFRHSSYHWITRMVQKFQNLQLRSLHWPSACIMLCKTHMPFSFQLFCTNPLYLYTPFSWNTHACC